MPTSWCDTAKRMSGLVVCLAFSFVYPYKRKTRTRVLFALT